MDSQPYPGLSSLAFAAECIQRLFAKNLAQLGKIFTFMLMSLSLLHGALFSSSKLIVIYVLQIM